MERSQLVLELETNLREVWSNWSFTITERVPNNRAFSWAIISDERVVQILSFCVKSDYPIIQLILVRARILSTISLAPQFHNLITWKVYFNQISRHDSCRSSQLPPPAHHLAAIWSLLIFNILQQSAQMLGKLKIKENMVFESMACLLNILLYLKKPGIESNGSFLGWSWLLTSSV